MSHPLACVTSTLAVPVPLLVTFSNQQPVSCLLIPHWFPIVHACWVDRPYLSQEISLVSPTLGKPCSFLSHISQLHVNWTFAWFQISVMFHTAWANMLDNNVESFILVIAFQYTASMRKCHSNTYLIVDIALFKCTYIHCVTSICFCFKTPCLITLWWLVNLSDNWAFNVWTVDFINSHNY